MHPLSLARSLTRRMVRRSVEEDVAALVERAVLRARHPLGPVFDASEMVQGIHGATVAVPDWFLKLSSRECSGGTHWHLVAMPLGDESREFDRMLDLVFVRTGGRGDMVDVTGMGVVRHWSWHTVDFPGECDLTKKLREVLHARGRRR